MGEPHHDFQRVRSPLEGSVVRLRAVEEPDLARINRGIWDPEVSAHLSVSWPQALAETEAWHARVRAGLDVVFVIETLAGDFAGGLGLHRIDRRNRSAELGVWVARPHWEKGYGTDAIRTACRFGFREMNLQRMGLTVYDTNPRGRHVYEKVGFKEEGRLRRAQFVGGGPVDAIVMGLLAEDLIES